MAPNSPLLRKADDKSRREGQCQNLRDIFGNDGPTAKAEPGYIYPGQSQYSDYSVIGPNLEKTITDRLKFAKLQDTCSKFGIRDCTKKECKNLAVKFRESAPECRWKEFRDWAITVAACICSQEGRPFKRGVLFLALQYCFSVRNHATDFDSTDDPHDPLGTFDVLCWMKIEKKFSPGWMENLWAGRETEIPALTLRIQKLLQQDTGKVCQRRLWSLVEGSARGLFDLPCVLSMLRQFPEAHIGKHKDCVADTCYLDDDNTTTIEQMHKCTEKETDRCDRQLSFNQKLLDKNNLDGPFRPKAWSLTPVRNGLEEIYSSTTDSYMAVSHVWADGTGKGSLDYGKVNACLIEYFANIAKEDPIKCEAIWWDTICVPVGRAQRAAALEEMHLNYRGAKHTLVHDKELTKFVWKDDGSPCVALALSTWFTRGWTALELKESKSVKVVFCDPQGKPIIKDLDQDILTSEATWPNHLAHRVASDAIRKLRLWSTHSRCYDNVVNILKPRYTSWPRDRLIIACLMADVKGFKSTWSKTKMTQAILLSEKTRHFSGDIHPEALLHRQPTMTIVGPWSWCPGSIFDLGCFLQPFVGTCVNLEKGGNIVGSWTCVPLNRASIVRPIQVHDSIKIRVEFALKYQEKCLLLRPDKGPYVSPASRDVSQPCLLVMNLGVHGESGRRHCQYIGTINARLRRGLNCDVCIGCDREPEWLTENGVGCGKDWGGWTPLHFATAHLDFDRVKKQLRRGESPEDLDEMGNTAWYWLEKGMPESYNSKQRSLIKKLLERGA